MRFCCMNANRLKHSLPRHKKGVPHPFRGFLRKGWENPGFATPTSSRRTCPRPRCLRRPHPSLSGPAGARLLDLHSHRPHRRRRSRRSLRQSRQAPRPRIPGGPWIDALALHGNPHAVPFSFAQIKQKVHLGGQPQEPRPPKPRPSPGLIRTSSSRSPASRLRSSATLSSTTSAPRPSPAARPLHRPRRPHASTFEQALAQCEPQTLDLIASFQHAVIGDS